MAAEPARRSETTGEDEEEADGLVLDSATAPVRGSERAGRSAARSPMTD